MYDTAEPESGTPPSPLGWDAEERVVPPSPAGNGHGPMRGLGRFYVALLAGGRPPGGGAASRVLSPQAVAALTARHRTGMFDHTFQHVMDWGLGFILDSKQYGADTVPYAYGRLCSPRTFGHSGYRTSTAFADPEAGLVVALAMNGAPSAAAHEARIRDVLDAVYRDLGVAWEAA
jgi:CubicO group peptidase (beta-lactamase class C family)